MIEVVFHCNGCDATARHRPLLRGQRPQEVAPEGWVAYDPWTWATYCPECFAKICEPSRADIEMPSAEGTL